MFLLEGIRSQLVCLFGCLELESVSLDPFLGNFKRQNAAFFPDSDLCFSGKRSGSLHCSPRGLAQLWQGNQDIGYADLFRILNVS